MRKQFTISFDKREYPCFYIDTAYEASRIIKQLTSKNTIIAADTETASLPKYRHIANAALSPFLGEPRLVQLFTGTGAVVIDLYKTGKIDLKTIFESRPSVFHNMTFDYKMLSRHYGLSNPDMHCTAIMARCVFQAIYAERVSASLATVSKLLFKEDVSKKAGASDWSMPDLTFEQIEYAAKDAIIQMKMYEKLSEYIDKLKLRQVYELYRKAQLTIARMELNGINVDTDLHKRNIIKWRNELIDARDEIQNITDLGIITDTKIGQWIESNVDEETLSYWPRSEKTGKISVDSNTLVYFKHIDVVKPFSVFQKKKKLTTSFGTNLFGHVNPETGRLHANYLVAGAKTGRLSCSSPNLQQCYSRDTEVLTKKGWVRIDGLEEGLEIAQWDKDFTISFVKPLRYIKHDKVPKLLRFSNTQTDLLVTHNHRCLVQKKDGTYADYEASNLPNYAKHIHSGNYVGGTEPVNEWRIRLLVATQADGYFHDGGIDFSFYKKRKTKRFELICNKLGIKISKSVFKNTKRTRYRIFKSGIVSDLYKELTKDKVFSWSILNWNKEALKVFIEEIRLWDGCVTRKEDAYSSIREQNADIVQTIYALHNRRSKKSIYTYNRDKNPKHSIAYVVNTPNRNHSWTTNIIKEEVEYNDTVFCVEVPSSYILVRRNNKIIVSGNCPRDYDMRRIFVPTPGYKMIVADYSQVEVRCQAEMAKDERMLKVFEDGIDIYAYVVASLLGKKIDSVTKEERNKGKCLVLGLGYGLGVNKFGHYSKKNYGLDISVEESKSLIDGYRKLFPKYREYQLQQVDNCPINRYTAYTTLGKISKFDDKTYFGGCMNVPIQGTCAEIMLQALIYAEEGLKNTSGRLLATVHDEILIEALPEDEEIAKNILTSSMTKAYLKFLPSGRTLRNLVEPSSGVNWGDAKLSEKDKQNLKESKAEHKTVEDFL